MYIMIISEELKLRRIKAAEKACQEAREEWPKDYWFNVFYKLCKQYGYMDYYRKTIH